MKMAVWKRYSALVLAAASGAFLLTLCLLVNSVNAAASRDAAQAITAYPDHVAVGKKRQGKVLTPRQLSNLAERLQGRSVRLDSAVGFTRHRGSSIRLQLLSARAVDSARITSGRLPDKPNEVLVPEASSSLPPVEVGTELLVSRDPVGRQQTLQVVGTYATRFSFSTGATPIVYVDDTSWKIVSSDESVVDFAIVDDQGHSIEPQALAAAIKQGASGHRLVSAAEYERWTHVGSRPDGALQSGIYFFVMIAVVTLTMLLHNMLRILSVSRRRDVALLRTLGASRRKAWWATTSTATLTGGVGVWGGVVLAAAVTASGVSLMTSMTSIRLDFSVPPGLLVAAGMAAHLVLVVIAAAHALWLCAPRVPAAHPRRGSQLLTKLAGPARLTTGSLLILGGLGLPAAGSGRLFIAGFSCFLVFVGALSILDLVVGGVLKGVSFVARLTSHVPSELSSAALVSAKSRTAGTVATVLLGAVLGSSMLVGVAALNRQLATQLRSGTVADLIIAARNPAAADTIARPKLADSSLKTREATVATGSLVFVTLESSDVSDQVVRAFGFDGATTTSGLKLADGVVYTARTDLGTQVILTDLKDSSSGIAGENDKSAQGAGNAATGKSLALPVVVDSRAGSELVMSSSTLARLGALTNPATFVSYRSTLSLAKYAEQALESYPESKGYVIDGAAMRALSFKSLLDRTLAVGLVLVGASVLVSVIGVVGALVFSQAERCRQFALLRSVGGSQRQVVATVVIEGLLLGALASFVSVALGVVFGARVAAAAAESPVMWVFPSLRLAAFAVATTALCGLAAVAPAKQAARVDVSATLAKS